MEFAPGKIFYVVNEKLIGYHIYLVLGRVEENEDWTDGLGSKGGKSEHGWYWRFLDLVHGKTFIMIDNSIELDKGWEML